MFCYVGKLVLESDGLAPIGPGSRTYLLFRPDDEIDDLDGRSWQQFDRWISVV